MAEPAALRGSAVAGDAAAVVQYLGYLEFHVALRNPLMHFHKFPFKQFFFFFQLIKKHTNAKPRGYFFDYVFRVSTGTRATEAKN